MKIIYCLILLCSFTPAFGQPQPGLRFDDKIRIKEAINISGKYGDKLFKGYSSVPFAIILVTDSTEFLIHHPNPSGDFRLIGYDTQLKSDIYYRKTQFNPHFLATFPAVNGLSCIVVGTPENTGKNSTEWIITLLHEHFHQYQASDPDYYASVNNLNLSGGDQTGMWMLNYPFPYNNSEIKQQFELYSKALYNTLLSTNKKTFKSNLSNYYVAKEKFKNLLSDLDYRYFSFQVWQEGLARNTEYEFLKLLKSYNPSKEVAALKDFVPFPKQAEIMYKNEMGNVKKQELNKDKRICFYSIGFAEGLLLNKLNPDWRKKYLSDKFYIENY